MKTDLPVWHSGEGKVTGPERTPGATTKSEAELAISAAGQGLDAGQGLAKPVRNPHIQATIP
jgi:hypothetical protein